MLIWQELISVLRRQIMSVNNSVLVKDHIRAANILARKNIIYQLTRDERIKTRYGCLKYIEHTEDFKGIDSNNLVFFHKLIRTEYTLRSMGVFTFQNSYLIIDLFRFHYFILYNNLVYRSHPTKISTTFNKILYEYNDPVKLVLDCFFILNARRVIIKVENDDILGDPLLSQVLKYCSKINGYSLNIEYLKPKDESDTSIDGSSQEILSE